MIFDEQHVHVHIMPRRSKDFEENDEIYEELNTHDKGPALHWRTKEEMKMEAEELRQFFKSLNWKKKNFYKNY